MGHALIIVVTLLWVLAILVHRSRACKYWRAHDRRGSCLDCPSRTECSLYDKFGITKACEYTGPDRRNVSLMVRHRDRGLARSA